MSFRHAARTLAVLGACLSLMLAGGCSLLRPAAGPQPSFYSLDSAVPAVNPAVRASSPRTGPTLIVNPPHASPGFDSKRIVYLREAHKLEYYAHNQWIDTPARMSAPLVVTALENTGAFRAVVLTPSAAAGDLRLDTEIVRLQHEFGSQPSRVRFTLRAYIVDNLTRRVLAWREFEESSNAASEDPYGGVIAANRAVQTVLERLATFCAETAAGWKPAGLEVPKRAGS